MNKVKGFDTLAIKEHGGKFYIMSLYDGATIGPAFNSIDELEKFADEKYTREYC